MMKNIGLWIDHKKAVIVIQNEQGETFERSNQALEDISVIGETLTQNLPKVPNINREVINWIINSLKYFKNFMKR
jgi:actin-like ATPase involved in cell morphogenesis